jgi:hypothetical protein
MSLQDKQRQINALDQRIKELEEATKRLKLREILKKQELERAVLTAKNKATKEVLDAVKAKIPASPPSFYKPSARALLSDLHRVIREEEEEIKKSAKKALAVKVTVQG